MPITDLAGEPRGGGDDTRAQELGHLAGTGIHGKWDHRGKSSKRTKSQREAVATAGD